MPSAGLNCQKEVKRNAVEIDNRPGRRRATGHGAANAATKNSCGATQLGGSSSSLSLIFILYSLFFILYSLFFNL
jgi:hypothetical protein